MKSICQMNLMRNVINHRNVNESYTQQTIQHVFCKKLKIELKVVLNHEKQPGKASKCYFGKLQCSKPICRGQKRSKKLAIIAKVKAMKWVKLSHSLPKNETNQNTVYMYISDVYFYLSKNFTHVFPNQNRVLKFFLKIRNFMN